MNKILLICKDDGELKKLAKEHFGGEVCYIAELGNMSSEQEEIMINVVEAIIEY